MSQFKIVETATARTTYPTGDRSFAVKQAFPAGISAESADPFLMLDHFGPTLSHGSKEGPDEFPVDWHPHRGQDLLTYMIEGKIRHADSMGNRGECDVPGAQWISAGSGIEHAEGGGVPAGQYMHGFQIWINVPSKHKMDNPRYGTQPPDTLPLITYNSSSSSAPAAEASTGRVISGKFISHSSHAVDRTTAQGPFATQTPTHIVDFVVKSGDVINHVIPPEMDQCLVYVYRGEGEVQGKKLGLNQVVRLNANEITQAEKVLVLKGGGDKGISVLVFAGIRLNQPIAWHGPFVMTTDEEIRETIREYRQGTFLKVRASWNYKKIATKPGDTDRTEF